MKRRLCVLAGVLSASLLLTGCSSNNIAETVQQYQLVDRNELLVSSNMIETNEETTGLIYQYVTGNIKIDKNSLISPTESEISLIADKMTRVEAALHGKRNNAMSDDFINYMLWEFARTQKEWSMLGNDGNLDYDIVGIDPVTRKIFVDAHFKTTNNNKLEIPASVIIAGDPLETAYKEKRYSDYMAYMSAKYDDSSFSSSASFWGMSSDDTESNKRDAVIAEALSRFESVWGKVDLVLEEQQERSLIERLRNAIKVRDPAVNVTMDDQFYTVTGETAGGTTQTQTELSNDALMYIQARGIGTYTYTGITKQSTFSTEAYMTFRFILDFDFNLGSSTTLNVLSVYLMNYYINDYETPIRGMEIAPEVTSSLSVVAPYVDRVINSYQKCIEESNYTGLYSIFGTQKVIDNYNGDILSQSSRFADWDKYYVDWNRYAYVNFDAYTYEIVGWKDSTLRVLVTRSKKIRGKGTDMTMPTYEEKSLITMVVENDNLFIESEEVLSTSLVGEPVSMIKEVNGIADKIAYNEQSFSKENEAGVVEALKNFSKLQLTYANNPNTALTTASGTPGSLDFGVGSVAMENIKTTMSNISNVSEKIVWLGTWATKSNVYCKVRIREYFKGEVNDIDTEAYVGLVSRDGVWTVVTYDRVVANVVSKSNIRDKNCLTHDYINGESTSDYGNVDSTVASGESVEPSESQVTQAVDVPVITTEAPTVIDETSEVTDEVTDTSEEEIDTSEETSESEELPEETEDNSDDPFGDLELPDIDLSFD